MNRDRKQLVRDLYIEATDKLALEELGWLIQLVEAYIKIYKKERGS